jgi:hypothetical protein
MCAFEHDFITGELPAPYTDARPERFARAVPLPSRDFLAGQHE